MVTTIEDYIRLTVRDCKRLGYFTTNAVTTGVVRWTQGGHEVASVRLTTNVAGSVPYAVLSYQYRGEPVRTELTLRFKASNLKAGTGYYYFVCPVTGLSCRNLYLVNGRFVSRTAFRPLYRQQAETKTARRLAPLTALLRWEELITEKYRRLTYRGNLTPYGRRVDKFGERAGTLCNMVLPRSSG